MRGMRRNIVSALEQWPMVAGRICWTRHAENWQSSRAWVIFHPERACHPLEDSAASHTLYITLNCWSGDAGIQAAKLEDLERRLRADILNEASANSGRVLCHREQPHPQSAQGPSAMSTTSSSSSLASISRPSRRPGRANGSSGPPLLGQRRPQQTPASPLGRPPASDEPDPALPPSAEASGSDADDEEPAKPSPPLRQGSDVSEDITQKEDVQPDERVTAFWETIGMYAAAIAMPCQHLVEVCLVYVQAVEHASRV